MPILEPSYRAKGLFRHYQINTIYAGAFRPLPRVGYQRERIDTPDGDFLDLDWGLAGNGRQLLIGLHGLEGSADRPYIRSMVRHFNRRGWDAVGLNFRGCSDEPNRLLRSYHIGETGDLRWVIRHAIQNKGYRAIVLAGYSLGGNVLLKYLGEDAEQVPNEVLGGVAFSVPCDIEGANVEIHRPRNRIYQRRFMVSLNAKMLQKAQQFPGQINLPDPMPTTFRGFDDHFTAPLHGFRDAVHYWDSCNSLQFLPTLCRPALLASALDDSFLSDTCYPYDLAEQLPQFYLETPRHGGHVGFVTQWGRGAYWPERRAYRFVEEVLLAN